VAQEANRLYWETTLGVNRIVEALDLSKGALYDLLRPLAADERCDACGQGRVFTNRTARAQGESQCLACEEVAASASSAASAGEDGMIDTPPQTVHAIPETGGHRTLWIAALVGGVAGFFMGRALGGRRSVHVRRSSS
jgi:hypothetical protein